MYSFRFLGGSIGDDKFHCFIVGPQNRYASGPDYEEIHISEAVRRHFVEYETNHPADHCKTPIKHVKIFLSQMIHGMKTYQSFYLELMDDPAIPNVHIHLVENLHGFYFQGRARFLKKGEVLDLLDPASASRAIYMKQKTYAVEFLRKLIKIERITVKHKGRLLALPKKTGGGVK